MKAPAAKRLTETFRDLTPADASLIRALARHVDNPEALRDLIDTHCPETSNYVSRMYNDPYSSAMWRRTVALHAIDRLLGTCGVEPLGPVDMRNGPPYEYCNAGDPYVATLIYSRDSDALRIGSWGDIAERHPEYE